MNEEREKAIEITVDKEKKTFTLPDGRELPIEFKLPPEQEAEVDALVRQLYDKCKEICIPLLVSYGIAENDESEYICTTAMLPGPRTPLRFKTAMNILKDDSFFALAEKLRRMMNNKEDME